MHKYDKGFLIYRFGCNSNIYFFNLGIHDVKQIMPRQSNRSSKAGQQPYDPILPVAKDISEELWLICFDEFQVRL